MDFSDNVDDQLAVLSAVMTDAQFQKVEIANSFCVTPDAYVTLQEIKPQYDADGNGSYKNAEIQTAAQEQTEAPADSTDDGSFSQALLNQLLGRG